MCSREEERLLKKLSSKPMWGDVHHEHGGSGVTWAMLTMSQDVPFGMPWWHSLVGQMSTVIVFVCLFVYFILFVSLFVSFFCFSFLFFFFSYLCCEYIGPKPSLFPAIWQWCIGVTKKSSTRQQSKWGHNTGFSLKAPILTSRKCCASVSALLLLSMLSKFKLAEGCHCVLQSHSWLCYRQTCREEPAQEPPSPNAIIHTATPGGGRALPRSFPLPHFSALFSPSCGSPAKNGQRAT